MEIWATSVSLVEKFSLNIKWAENLIDRNKTIEVDNEKLYAESPPGIALLAAPIYAIVRVFLGNANETNTHLSWFVLRFWLSTLPIILLAYWLYKHDVDELSLGIFLFASPIFVYSLLLSASVLVSCLLYFAFRLIYDPQRIFLRNCFLAGLTCGFSFFCFPKAFFPIALMAAGILILEKQEKLFSILSFLLGFLPFTAFLFIYDFFFISSLSYRLSLKFQTFFYLNLISPTHGLFFYSPILIFSVLIFFISHQRRSSRHLIKTVLIVFSMIYFCLKNPTEYFLLEEIVLLLPFLMDSFFDGELYDRSNLWLGILFILSLVFCTIPALSFPLVPSEFKYPHNTLWTKLLIEQRTFTTNFASFFSIESNSILAVPVLLLLTFVLYQILQSARRPYRFLLGAVFGLLIAISYLFLPNLDNPKLRHQREVIVEQYL